MIAFVLMLWATYRLALSSVCYDPANPTPLSVTGGGGDFSDDFSDDF